jgi:nonsense-mediated mRNA decay protein 3
MTLQQTDITPPVYWRQPFNSLATVADLVEFVVLDIEPSGPVRGKYVLADAQITRASGSGGQQMDDDGMGDDGIYHTRTHLGAILQPGDTVLGYHLTNANFNSDDFEALDQARIPDVILVRKTYPNRRRKARARNWKLKSIAKEAEDVNDEKVVGRGALGRRGGVDQKNVERDYELFLRDLEEDKEMRAAVNLYRADAKAAAGADGDADMSGHKSGSGMAGGKRRNGQKKQGVAGDMEMDVEEAPEEAEEMDEDGHEGDDESEEEDFPEIELDELLEHFEEMGIEETEPQPGTEED